MIPSRLFWPLLLALTLAVSLWSGPMAKALGWGWLGKFPKAWELETDKQISAALKWLVEDATLGPIRFQQVTRTVSAAIEAPYQAMRALLIEGLHSSQGQQATEVLPSLSWLAILAGFAALAYHAGGARLALLVAGCFLYLAMFGQWHSAMITLASVAIAVPMGVIGGAALGIAAWRTPLVDRLLRPVLDLMQTVPVFAYLVPILFLFGFGPVSALVATIIYAMPPMVRITTLALREVPPEVVEAGRMAGCTRRQLLWKVQLPSARPALMVGVNQVIMLSLNMVIIASMIGAGGLGYDVLTALRRLDIGAGVEAGVAIVVMAIALDRLSQAFAQRMPGQQSAACLIWLVLGITLGTALAGRGLPWLQTYPAPWILSSGALWENAIGWINLHLYDSIEAVKILVLKGLLLPVKQFFTGIPWPWGIAAVTAMAWRLAGWMLGVTGAAMTGFIAASGLWPEAMVTLYLCGVSVLIAMAIGVPLGLWAASAPRAGRVIGAFIDTLQTLPSFVYLIPVVMLFRVGDVAAVIAVVLYALAPAVRYAAHGMREIDPQLVEAGIVSGCTPRQLLWKVKLPLALPALLLGLNQTIMLALSMLVITALVGTRDLGQQVYIALTKANTGQGVVAGLAVAFIAILADRMLTALAGDARRKRGAA